MLLNRLIGSERPAIVQKQLAASQTPKRSRAELIPFGGPHFNTVTGADIVEQEVAIGVDWTLMKSRDGVGSG